MIFKRFHCIDFETATSIGRYSEKCGNFGTIEYRSVDAERGYGIKEDQEDMLNLLITLVECMLLQNVLWADLKDKIERIRQKTAFFTKVGEYIDVCRH